MQPSTTAATFEFTEQDYTRIILQDSLFNSDTTRDNASTSFKQLQRLEERETRLFLHAVTLSDYMRAKRIPRGLRINKGPIIGKDKSTFCDQWAAILNKCSFDLMALTIQEVTTSLAAVRDEITEAKNKLNTELTDPGVLRQRLEECEKLKQQLATEITMSKKEKFERDALDYERGRIYQWRNAIPKKRPGRSMNDTRLESAGQLAHPLTDREYESESSNVSQASSSFLADRNKHTDRRYPSRPRNRGRGKGAGGR